VSIVHRSPRPLRRPDCRWRPTLETLEDRTTPTALAGLGAAGQFAILDINGGHLTIGSSSVAGNIGLGPHATGTLQRDGVTGAVDVDPSATLHAGRHDLISGGIVPESLAQAQTDANAASAAYAALAPTQSFGNRTASLTVTGNGGTNVIAVTSLDFNHKTLTLSGGPNDVFIFNVARDLTFNHSQIVLTGGVTANHVIFNFAHAASSIDISNSSNVVGTFLAPRGSLALDSSASFQGELIAKNLGIHTDPNLTAAGFTLPVTGASLSGFVYADANFDGIREPGEAGISDVTIVLTGVDAQGNAVSLTTVTNSDGSYTFTNLAAGTYQLTEQLPSYYFNGTNAVGKVNGTTDGALVGSNAIGSIVLTAGNVGVEYDFAVVPPGA
jgi:SdrD B-like domain